MKLVIKRTHSEDIMDKFSLFSEHTLIGEFDKLANWNDSCFASGVFSKVEGG